jgi:predicted dehydrogenase
MEMVVEAARAGKHLVLEKPLEVTLERADAIIDACRSYNVKAAVIFQSRFADLFRKLKEALDRGDLGRLIQGDCYVKWFRPAEYYSSSDWKGTLEYDGGGALINQSIHGIDLLGWLMGPVDSVFGYTDHLLYPDIEGEDTAAAVLRFANGALGVIQGTTSLYPGFTRRIEIHGTKGSVIVDEDQITLWETVDKTPPPQPPAKAAKGGAADPAAISFQGHARQIADLCRAITEDSEPMIDVTEGRKALELVLAIYRSSAEGREIKLPL